jgi:hypothetical protein
MATEFQDKWIVINLDPAGTSLSTWFSTFDDAREAAEAWAESDVYGIKYMIVPGVAVAKVV